MLHQFFAIFIIFIVSIIFLIAFIIIKIVLPMWRFMVRADAVIELYKIFETILEQDFSSKEEKIEISYGKYKIEFANTNEASIEFEKIVNEALEYYDKLGWIAIADDSFKVQKNKLINICSEVRTLRWKKQGI